MKPQRLSVHFPARQAPEDLEPAIAMFHRFIQQHLVEGQLIDVADNRHIPGGPGVALIAHDVDYRLSPEGLTVTRKRATDDDLATQLRDALRMGHGALAEIAHDGAIELDVDTASFRVDVLDRRLEQHHDDLPAAVAAAVEAALRDTFGEASATPLERDHRSPAAATATLPAEAAADALPKLGGSRAVGQSPWDITVDELARLRDTDAPFVLLDVREQQEVEIVTIGGTHLPSGELEQRLDELDPDVRTIVHCRAGWRGAVAVETLRNAGFTDAWNVRGGLMAWIERIDPSLPKY